MCEACDVMYCMAMSGSFQLLRKRLEEAEKSIEDDTITPEEVMKNDKAAMAEKIAIAKYRRNTVQKALRRFKKARTANDVFSDFAKDAARATVMEMLLALSSGDRQRAAETILNRALGKPVDRIMSVGMQVSAKSDPELDHDIRKLLADLGFEGREGTPRQISAIEEGRARYPEADELQTESRVEWRAGISRKIYQIDSEG